MNIVVLPLKAEKENKMNREIKFRAWDDGIMVYCENFQDDRNYSAYDYLRFFFGSIRSDAISMQYTGLNDRNGKEIYEGDLLNIGNIQFGFIKNGNGNFVNYEVVGINIDYTLFRKDLSLTWGKLSSLDEMGWDCEVIGNIYENPELLEK